MYPIRPVEPLAPYDPGPMPPHTSPYALAGIATVALGMSLLEVLPFLALSRYLALGGVTCGVIGMTLGVIALGHISRNAKRVEGRPMALVAVILGALEALGYLALFWISSGGLRLGL